MKVLVLLIVFIAFAQVLLANQIKGIIKDARTGEEIIGATIVVKGEPTRGAVTGLDGSFIFQHQENAPLTLVCSYVGYETREILVGIPGNTLSIVLEPASVQFSEVVVYGYNRRDNENSARTIERTAVNVMNVVSAKAIEISPDLTVANVIQRMSGVTVERNHSGDGQYAILRGMDKRYNYTLVNGIKIPSPDNKNRFVPLDIFPSELLDRLEVTKALTADMEGDGIGGAVNLVMKDAPGQRQLTFNVATGYNALFFDRDFYSFDRSGVQKKSPYEIYGDKYAAKARDFSASTLRLKSGKPSPNLNAGFSYGDRFFSDRLGLMLAGSFQNSYRGSNSLYFESATATSDASNLPVLTVKNDRTYSEQQMRYGLHAKFDYRLAANHQLQWYNAYMYFENSQVRDMHKTDLSIGYDPEAGDYNLSFDTRFRLTRQHIYNSTLKGFHQFARDRFKIDWSAVYSQAYNEQPDNSSVHTVSTVRGGRQNSVSVTTLGGADRRWEHNSDRDWAGYLNLSYHLKAGDGTVDLYAGGLFRDKQRANFFNQYDFRPYDESKSEGTRNNLIKGVDWNDYSEIKFNVHTPYGSLGNPLNYDASEKIGAGYGQAKYILRKLQLTAGLRVEHTQQGYDLLHPTDGVKNTGEQVYTDYLPSVHLKYEVFENSNLRTSYFKSLNRPGFFEIVPYRIINEDYVEMGNPDLEHTVAHNADLRYEYFPRPSEQIMVGVFYKKIKQPIESGMVTQGQGTFFMPTNFGDADNYGVELDFTKYFRSFGIKANYTYTRSQITTTKLQNYLNPDPAASDKVLVRNVDQIRPLNGQAAHVANLSLLYKNTERRWDAQTAFTYTGERLYAISRYLDNDIWEGGYFQLDASVEKGFKFGLSVFAKATNLLNTPMVQFLKKQNKANAGVDGYKDYNDGTLVRKDHYGQNFMIGCRYKL